MERYKVTQQFIDELNDWKYDNSYEFDFAFNFTTMPQSVIDYWYDEQVFHLERFIDVLKYLQHPENGKISDTFIIYEEE